MPFQNISTINISSIQAIPTNLYAPIGTVFAACIGGTISFLALVISKENEVSKFRQGWIDGMHSDIAKFLSTTEALAVILDKYNKNDAEKAEKSYLVFTSENKLLHSDLLTNYRSLQLRLNPQEHIKLTSLVDKLYSEFHKHPINTKEIRKVAGELVVEAQKSLKTEWKRVKRGEITFKIVKIVTAAIVITLSLYIGKYLINSGVFSAAVR